jgi:ABC-type Fe3+-hydroxamate transport system substrate-binding protein
MRRYRVTDALGRELSFSAPPRRVVSLVPSETYNVESLGAGELVVGRTDYCQGNHAMQLPSVGGTKSVNIEAVVACQPDLILANQEENSRASIEQLAHHAKIFVSLPRRFDDGISHLAKLAKILGVESSASVKALVGRGMKVAKLRVPDDDVHGEAAPRLSAFIPIWHDPWMTCNRDTFGADMLAMIGIRNVFGERQRLYPLAADLGKGPAVTVHDRDVRYPRCSMAEIAARNPDLILFPDEPFVFEPQQRAELAAALPNAKQVDVSGKDLFWHGAWSIDAVARLREAIFS